jgi:hypothetical protein
MTYILELITLMTIVGTICYLTEKFVIEKDNECNSSQRK